MIIKKTLCERFIPKGFDAKFSMDFDDMKRERPYAYTIHILPRKRTALVNIIPLIYVASSDVVSIITYRNNFPQHLGFIFPEFMRITDRIDNARPIGIYVIYNIFPKRETITYLSLRSIDGAMSGMNYIFLHEKKQ